MCNCGIATGFTPDEARCQALAQAFGNARVVFNDAVAARRDAYPSQPETAPIPRPTGRGLPPRGARTALADNGRRTQWVQRGKGAE